MDQFLRRLQISFTILIIVIIVGTGGFKLIGGHKTSLVDAFYMTMITVTTIGYGEIIHLEGNPAGRIFAIFIALSGIGSFTYILTNLTAFAVGDQLFKTLRRKKMEKEIANLKDHYIICGVGDIGLNIARELEATHRKFVLIDKQGPELSGSDFDFLYLQGDATNEEVLEKAAIHNSLGIFAVTGDDNYNLVITFTARTMRQDIKIISKCREISHIEKMKKAGADSVIAPNIIGGLRMVSLMIRPTVVSFLDTMLRDKDQSLRVEEITLGHQSDGKTVKELNINKYESTLLLAIKTGDEYKFNPSSLFKVREDDVLVIMASPQAREELIKRLGDIVKTR